MRGLGIGIIVTAIIMSFTRQPQELTEAQIKAKARELGMVEENVLADLKKDDVIIQEETEKKDIENAETSEEITETEVTFEGVTEENTIDEEVVSENTVNEETMSETTDVENNSDENTGEIIPEEENNQESVIEEAEELSEKYVVISINGGNGSEIVSKRLYEAGLVSSEEEYNKFLVKNGYDRKLRVGNHEIPVGATEEEIAKILCGKN